MAITQRQEQIQEQKLVQQQKLTQQHMMMIHLLEMPLTELEQSIKAELDDNPALETADHVDAMMAGAEGTAGMGDDTADEDFEARTEREEREDALDTALSGLGMDDEMPEPSFAMDNMESADYEEIVYGDRMSFYDRLKEQMVDVELTEVQEYIIEYIIGSLDSDLRPAGNRRPQPAGMPAAADKKKKTVGRKRTDDNGYKLLLRRLHGQKLEKDSPDAVAGRRSAQRST